MGVKDEIQEGGRGEIDPLGVRLVESVRKWETDDYSLPSLLGNGRQ